MKSEEIISAVVSSRALSVALDAEDDGHSVIRRCTAAEIPLVCVEVLAYNQGHYLRKCVESIVSQRTTFRFEVIIGNDCSSDDTQQVAEQLQREHPELITIVTTRHNVGLNRNARNVRRLMRGEFAAFCEGDDWWVGDDRLQKQVDYMQAHSGVTLLHGLPAFYDEKTSALRQTRQRYRFSENRFWNIFDETYRIETASVICRVRDLKRIYEECPQLIGARYKMLDTQLFCLLASYGTVRHFDDVLSLRRISGKSLSRNDDLHKTICYHDNAFTMKMALCDYFKVGFWPRFRSENFYLVSSVGLLAREFGWRRAARVVKELYPSYGLRVSFIGMLRMPRIRFLRKLYNRIVFPAVKYRNAFA